MKKRILSLLLVATMLLSLLPMTVFAEECTKYVSASGNDATGTGAADAPFATIQKAIDSIPNSGTVILLSDLNVSTAASNNYAFEILGGKDITLDGGGYKVKMNNAVRPFCVSVGKLTLTNVDIDMNGHQYNQLDDGKYTIQVLKDGELVLNDGAIIENAKYGDGFTNFSIRGTATMNDGAIIRNMEGLFGAIRVEGYDDTSGFGNFYMNGGLITGCTSESYGYEGVVFYISVGGKMVMTGGTITGNQDKAYSPGTIFLHANNMGARGYNEFTATGGTITGNSAIYGGVVYTNNNVNKINISGNVNFTGNTGTEFGGESNLYLGSDLLVNLEGGMGENSMVGVYTSSVPSNTADVKFAFNAAKADAGHFISDKMSTSGIIYDDGEKCWNAAGNEIIGYHHVNEANTLWLSTAAAGYAVDISSEIEHGTVTPNLKCFCPGDTVTLTVTTDEGYQLKSLTATPVAPTISTIADVLATVEEFPKDIIENSSPTVPSDAWTNGTGSAFTYKNLALVLKNSSYMYAQLTTGVTFDATNKCYTATVSTLGTLKFNMTDGVLTSFEYTATNTKHEYDGTYAPASTPSPRLKPITPAKQTDGTYQFTMPGYAVTVTAEFEAIGGTGSGEWFGYCTEDIQYKDSIGVGGGTSLTFAIKIPVASLPNQDVLSKVSFHTNESGTYHVRIYSTDPSAADPGTAAPDYEQEFTVSNPKQWEDIVLTTPYEVDKTKNLWIGIEATDPAYPATHSTEILETTDCCMMYFQETWSPITELGFFEIRPWMIRGYFETVTPVSGGKTLPYSFDFETDMVAEGWTNIDNDGDGQDWITGTTAYAGNGFGNNGSECAVSQSYENNGNQSFNADNWLFSPAITIPAGGAIVSWYEQSQDPVYPDSYEVYICETNTEIDLSKMTKIFSGTATNPWTQRSVELEAAEYAGKTVYIAFRHNCYDCYFLEIDDFAVEAAAPAHTHAFTYTANNGKLTATCTQGCDKGYDTTPLTLTLTAPTSLVYDGNAKAFTFADGEAAAWTGAGLELPTFEYYLDKPETPWLDGLDGDPIAAAEGYVVKIRVGVKVAQVEFNIDKATPYIKTAPAPNDIEYGKKLSDSTLFGGYVQVSSTNTTQVAGLFEWKLGDTIPALSDSETTEYDVTFTPADTNNYNTVSCKVKIKVTHTHNPVKVNGQAATETAAGWSDYYECKDSTGACHKYFEDASGLVEITDLDAWKAQGGNIPKLTHNPTLSEGKPATFNEPGYKPYYLCNNCGKYYYSEDATGLIEIPDINAWKAKGGNGYIPSGKEKLTVTDFDEEPVLPGTETYEVKEDGIHIYSGDIVFSGEIDEKVFIEGPDQAATFTNLVIKNSVYANNLSENVTIYMDGATIEGNVSATGNGTDDLYLCINIENDNEIKGDVTSDGSVTVYGFPNATLDVKSAKATTMLYLNGLRLENMKEEYNVESTLTATPDDASKPITFAVKKEAVFPDDEEFIINGGKPFAYGENYNIAPPVVCDENGTPFEPQPELTVVYYEYITDGEWDWEIKALDGKPTKEGTYLITFYMPESDLYYTGSRFYEYKIGHNIQMVEGKAATTEETGYKAYYECKGCGKFYEDASGLVEITDLAKWKAQGGNGYIAKLEKQTDPTDPKSPQTGDNSHMTLWLIMMALSSTGLCACLVLGKKRKYSNKENTP